MNIKNSRSIANYIFLIFIISFIGYSIYYILNTKSSDFNILKNNMTQIKCVTSICFDHVGILECMETTTSVLIRETSEPDLRYNTGDVKKITFKVIGVNCQ